MMKFLSSEKKMIGISMFLALVPGLLLFVVFHTAYGDDYRSDEQLFPYAYTLLALGGLAGGLSSMRTVYLIVSSRRLSGAWWRIALCIPCMFACSVYFYALLLFIPLI